MQSSILAVIGSLGGAEMVGILVLVLLLFGAKKLPELARGVGKSMGEFKRARDDFEREITRSDDDAYYGRKDTPPTAAEVKTDEIPVESKKS